MSSRCRPSTARSDRRRRHGTILVVTMLIVFTLASMVLVVCSSMRVEATAAANMAASLQASTIERGAEQYVIALLTEQKDTLADLTEDYFQQVPVGDGFFWIVRPDYDDTNLPLFGLTEENAKLNVNASFVNSDSLMKLPYMTDDVAAAIVNWRGGAATGTSSGGSPDQYYASMGYQGKQGAYESVEELLLVRGINRQMLYGDGTAPPLGVRSNNVTSSTGTNDMIVARGWFNYLTCYSTETAAAGGGQKVDVNDAQNRQTALGNLLSQKLSNSGRVSAIMGLVTTRSRYLDVFDFAQQTGMKSDELDLVYDSLSASQTAPGGGGATTTAKPVVGRVNVNAAPREVLMCLPGIESADADKLIAARQSNQPGTTTVGWLLTALDKKVVGLGNYVTGKTSQYSADIIAVTGNGRAFKRVRIVVNASGTTPQITYRRDLTDRGWPMDPQILASLRAGQQLDTTGSTTGNVGRGMSAGGSFR